MADKKRHPRTSDPHRSGERPALRDARIRSLPAFVRQHKQSILRDFRAVSRDLRSRQRSLEQAPHLLDHIASTIEQLERDGASMGSSVRRAARGLERLDGCCDVRELTAELGVLRDCILRRWGRVTDPTAVGHGALFRAVDLTILALVDRDRDAREESRRAERARAKLLIDAGRLLSRSLDYRATLDHVAEIAVPRLGDCCGVDVLAPDGTLHDFVAFAERDPDACALVRDRRARVGPPPALRSVLRSGRPALAIDVSTATDSAFGTASWLFVPLVVRGRVFGALTLARTGVERAFERSDVQLAVQFARIASTAIENARLHEDSMRAVELRELVLAVVSHDLRSPLAAIDSAAVLLDEIGGEADQRTKTSTALIRRNVSRAARLIGDLLDMANIQAGRLALRSEPCALRGLLSDALEAHREIARRSGIELRDEADVSCDVVCDRDRVQQILSNLLGNALKFCRTGHCVTLRARAGIAETTITVADTGPGIAASDLPHVFDLFWKNGRQGGSGLGLFICRGVVEAHRGRIGVKSEAGHGTEFWFTLPRATFGVPQP